MRLIRLRSPLRFSLPWLMSLALLLPIAQFASTWHAMSHALVGAGIHDLDKQSPHTVHCDLCLITAAVSGGALVSAPPRIALPSVRHSLPLAVAVSVWLSLPTLAYQSRAPPSVPR